MWYNHIFLSPFLTVAKHWNGGHFTNLLKLKYIFSEGESRRESACMCARKSEKDSPPHFTVVFISPCCRPEWRPSFSCASPLHHV